MLNILATSSKSRSAWLVLLVATRRVDGSPYCLPSWILERQIDVNNPLKPEKGEVPKGKG
jgi:hypothetical protein